MTALNRRFASALFAAAMLGSIAAEPALAQATNAPPGGIPSSTAPSNSQGTPSGGTGVVGGATTVAPSAPEAIAPAPRRTRRVRHRRHTVHHRAAPADTGTDSGTNSQ